MVRQVRNMNEATDAESGDLVSTCYSCGCDEYYLMGHDTVESGRNLLTFRGKGEKVQK
jgi:hypothetical protein